MIYAYIDGDDIGLGIENSFMNNDEVELKRINQSVKESIREICKYLTNTGAEIIFGGADGIICKSEELDIKSLLEWIRESNSLLTFSIGSSNSLRGSFLALRYAKANGKNIAAIYNDEFTLIK